MTKPLIFFGYDISIGNQLLPNGLTIQSLMMQYFLMLNHEDKILMYEPEFAQVLDLLDGTKYMGSRRDWGHSYIAGHVSMQKYADCHNASVHELRQKGLHYIYPVNVGPWFDRFASNKLLSRVNKNAAGDFLYKKMTQAVINDISEGRATLLLDYTQENFIAKSQWEDFHEVIDMTSFSKENVLVYFNTFNGKELYDSWFTEEERKVTAVNCPFLLAWNMDKHTLISEESVIKTKTRIRDDYFTYKNHSPRAHRKMLFLALFQLGLIDKSNWSWLSDEKFNHEDNAELIDKKILKEPTYDIVDYHEQQHRPFHYNKFITDKLNEKLPKNLVGESKGVSTPGWGEIDTTYEPYLNSYFDIVTETFYDNQSNENDPWYKHESLTEKVWKPIAFYQPFIIVSWPGSLAKIRELGFKTYDPYIDESYDLETNPDRRMEMIINEIQKLCKKTPEELHEWYWNMWEIIKYNHDKLADTWDNSQYAESMQILIDKCNQV